MARKSNQQEHVFTGGRWNGKALPVYPNKETKHGYMCEHAAPQLLDEEDDEPGVVTLCEACVDLIREGAEITYIKEWPPVKPAPKTKAQLFTKEELEACKVKR